MELEDQVYHLSKTAVLPLYQDYAALKEQGYECIASYSGTTWTNYNDSDPGVTMMQILCYALTELGNKVDFPIGDLLTGKDGSILFEGHFYTPPQAYTSNAVTYHDVCKLILDAFPIVKQVYLSQAFGPFFGMISLSLECKPDLAGSSGMNIEEVRFLQKKVLQCLRNHANVGQWYLTPAILQPCNIFVSGSIRIKKGLEIERVIAFVLYTLNDFLSPYPVYHSYTSLYDNGTDLADCMQGPLLEGGYITDDKIPLTKRKRLNIDEMGAVLLSTEFFEEVKSLSIFSTGLPERRHEINFSFDEVPVFSVSSFQDVSIFQNAQVITSWNEDKVRYYYQQLVPVQVSTDWTTIEPKGNHRNVGYYYSIQHDFPSAYRLNDKSIESKAHLARVNQLKGYLALYEQLLADFAINLDGVSSFYSFASGRDNSQMVSSTYRYQPLYTVPGMDRILEGVLLYTSHGDKSSWQMFVDDPENPYRRALEKWVKSDPVNLQRKLRAMEHLLARSGKQYDHVPLALTNPRYRTDTIAEMEYLQSMLLIFPEKSANRTRTYYRSTIAGLFISGMQLGVEYELSLNAFYQGIEEAVAKAIESDTLTIGLQQNNTVEIVYGKLINASQKVLTEFDGHVLVWWNEILVLAFETTGPLDQRLTKEQSQKFLAPYLAMLTQLRVYSGFVFIDTVRLLQSQLIQWNVLDDRGNPIFTSEAVSPDLAGKQMNLVMSDENLELQQSCSTQLYEIGVRTNLRWNFICSEIKTEAEGMAIIDALLQARKNGGGNISFSVTDAEGGMSVPSGLCVNATASFFPNWIHLFGQSTYQDLLTRKVVEHSPASTRNSVWLLSLEEMQQLMECYSIWIDSLANTYDGHDFDLKGRRAAKDVLQFLAKLESNS